ncbi:carboxylesterase family protein [Streptomyces humi]
MAGTEHTVVDTDRGKVRGVAEGEAVSFRGIPYAASPVGELRFAAPRPHPGWTDVRDVATAGPSVPQAASRLDKVQGQRVPDWNEDGSLTVNVFTPRGALDVTNPAGIPNPCPPTLAWLMIRRNRRVRTLRVVFPQPPW